MTVRLWCPSRPRLQPLEAELAQSQKSGAERTLDDIGSLKRQDGHLAEAHCLHLANVYRYQNEVNWHEGALIKSAEIACRVRMARRGMVCADNHAV